MRTGSTALLSCLNALSMETSTSGHAFADFATHRLSSKPPSLPTHGQNRRTTSRLLAVFHFSAMSLAYSKGSIPSSTGRSDWRAYHRHSCLLCISPRHPGFKLKDSRALFVGFALVVSHDLPLPGSQPTPSRTACIAAYPTQRRWPSDASRHRTATCLFSLRQPTSAQQLRQIRRPSILTSRRCQSSWPSSPLQQPLGPQLPINPPPRISAELLRHAGHTDIIAPDDARLTKLPE